jgi:hypothetical protein
MATKAAPRERPASAKPFPEGKSARPQADVDPDSAGDRSGAAEDVAQTDAPENDGGSGAEDNVQESKPGAASPSPADPRHRGDRRTRSFRRDRLELARPPDRVGRRRQSG